MALIIYSPLFVIFLRDLVEKRLFFVLEIFFDEYLEKKFNHLNVFIMSSESKTSIYLP